MTNNPPTKKGWQTLAALFFATPLLLASPAMAAGGSSVQIFGSAWEAGDSGRTTGYGIKTSLGSELALDLGWTHFGSGDDITLDLPAAPEDTTRNKRPTRADAPTPTTAATTTSVTLDGASLSAWDLGFRYTFPGDFYAGAGASFLDFNHDDASIDGEIGLYGLCGWTFGANNIRGFIEAIYRNGQGTLEYERSASSVTSDLDVTGFGVNVGVMFRF